MKNKVTLLNVISNLLLQIATLISGFIIPKLILANFGSEVNGLVSSINQFLSYITLIEGGVTAVITANLYGPLVEKNNEKLSSVMKTTNDFYKKIGLIFIIYSILLSIIYPLFFAKNFSYFYVLLLVLILSINLLVQYMFSLSLKTLLTADKKIYVVSLSQTAIVILNILLTIISLKIFPSIHFFKLISGILFLLQPIIFTYYVNRHYDLNKSSKSDIQLLKNRWDGFAINLAAFIHFSTDITILTIFTDLSTVSIYSVYSLISTGLRAIINSIAGAITPVIGHALAYNKEKELLEKFSLYEFIIFMVIYILFSVALFMTVPFIMIYTRDIKDTNYFQPVFAVLLLVSEMIYLIKYPHLNLCYSANKFKDITNPAFVESGLNILLSLILVNRFGLIGIMVGTIVGMLYRMIFQVFYTKKIISSYHLKSFFFKLLSFTITLIIYVIISIILIGNIEYDIISWIIYAFIYLFISITLYSLLSLLLYKNDVKYLYSYLFKLNK